MGLNKYKPCSHGSGAIRDPRKEPKQVFAKTIFGKMITTKLYEEDTVDDCKAAVAVKCGIPTKHQILIFMGKQLVDGRGMKRYGIANGCILHMTTRLIGGVAEVPDHLDQQSMRDLLVDWCGQIK